MEGSEFSLMTSTSRPELFDFEGISMVHYFTDDWENVQNFQARPDDILIATYPKAGVELVNNLPTTPRLIKTHLPVQLVPKSFWEQNCKVIYVARNAKDNAVSYFHFERMNLIQPDPGDWSNYLQMFKDGKKVFGPWHDHVTGYWEKKQTYSNLHYMFFEDMVENTDREVERLSSFLGVSAPKEEREKITKNTHFDAMKQNKMTNYSTIPVMNFSISPFMRKGKVGDWKNHFTVAQNEQFDKHYKEKMKNPTLKFRTQI